MEIEVNEQSRTVTVWLTNAEKVNERLRENLKPFYKAYHDDKYFVAEMESGQGDLTEAMSDLLRYNKIAIAKQQLAAEKAEEERLAALEARDDGQVMSM